MTSSEYLREALIPRERDVSDIANAGWWSQLCFLWINPIMKLGSKRTLTDTDMPAVAPEDSARDAFDRFSTVFWSSWSTSLFAALFTCYWRPLAVNGVFALLKCIAVSGGPLVLKAFVATAASTSPDRARTGCLLVAVLLAAKLVESASQRQWIFGSKRVGMQARSAVMAALYAKQLRRSMRLSADFKGGGEVISYMAVDSYRIGELGFWIHLVWSIPLQILLAAGILIHSVGLLPSLAGMSVIFASMVANRPLARMQRRFQDGVMRAQDDRLRATAAAVRNMKIIKLHAWEEHFGAEIERLRAVETDWLSKVQFRKTYNSFLFWLLPILVSTSTFIVCWATGRPLDAGSAFTTLATFRIIQEPIRQVPDLISAFVQAKVSEARIATFLREQEFDRGAVRRLPAAAVDRPVISMENVSLSWEPDSGSVTLRNINFRVPGGGCKVAVCGEVGSGKSTLLYSILGEVPKLCGTISTSGSFAYVPQSPWIQCGTIRDNILFGLEMAQDKYAKVLKVCALDKDLESLPFGDATEIGERGVNLSGGQKQRIQLARAVYQDTDVYLLDDPFSALDAETGSTLFKSCILGALSTKTVVLVTHQVEFLPSFDNILIMQNGAICESGSYGQLRVEGSSFEKLVTAHNEVMGNIDTRSTRSPLKSVQQDSPELLKPSQLTKVEERQAGDTGMKAYMDYMKQAHGFFYFGLSFLAYGVFVTGQMSANWWMASQVGNPETSTAKLIGVYSTIGLTTGCFLFIRSVFIVVMGLAASKSFFSGIMGSLFAAPISFFDSTPSGRILNRLSLDMSILDLDVPFSFAFSVSAFVNALTNLGMTTSVTWQILIVVMPLMYLNRVLQVYYLASARELMRINGTTKAPILNLFGEAISGSTIIRAFKKQDEFMDKNLRLIDLNTSPFFYNFAAREWLIQRLEALWSCVLCTSSLIMVMLPPGQIAPGFVGMVLSYGLSLNLSQVGSVQNQCNLANMIISVERIKQYMGLPSEPFLKKQNLSLPPCWPRQGKVELCNLEIRYTVDAPLVLKGITCTFEPGQKVGIVGRTGSGKTTLISALFRLVDPAGGKIFIDGLDITMIGLRELRSRLSIIPQEPTLFRGTVRFNLDPLGQFNDQEIVEVLEKCQLWRTINEKPHRLDSFVGDDGENWSIGERQLFCLGRVLLKNSQILVLDEATASIDNATDAIIQSILRDEFRKCTTITVAHRIPTVINSDMVMTLHDGHLVEFDHPSNLLQTTSLFSRLVAEYWASLQTTTKSVAFT